MKLRSKAWLTSTSLFPFFAKKIETNFPFSIRVVDQLNGTPPHREMNRYIKPFAAGQRLGVGQTGERQQRRSVKLDSHFNYHPDMIIIMHKKEQLIGQKENRLAKAKAAPCHISGCHDMLIPEMSIVATKDHKEFLNQLPNVFQVLFCKCQCNF